MSNQPINDYIRNVWLGRRGTLGVPIHIGGPLERLGAGPVQQPVQPPAQAQPEQPKVPVGHAGSGSGSPPPTPPPSMNDKIRQAYQARYGWRWIR